jgi:Ca2+-binding EF-hand superfamily protein
MSLFIELEALMRALGQYPSKSELQDVIYEIESSNSGTRSLDGKQSSMLLLS